MLGVTRDPAIERFDAGRCTSLCCDSSEFQPWSCQFAIDRACALRHDVLCCPPQLSFQLLSVIVRTCLEKGQRACKAIAGVTPQLGLLKEIHLKTLEEIDG